MHNMRVIKEGIIPSKMFRGQCNICKSIMEENKGKLNVESYQRDPGPFAHAVCPVCSSNFVMYPKKDFLPEITL